MVSATRITSYNVCYTKLLRYLKSRYPKVNLSLHAGELTLGLVPPEDLRDHIALAIEAGARRIGHGTGIAFEDRAEDSYNFV